MLTPEQNENEDSMKEFYEQFDIDIVPIDGLGPPYDYAKPEND